MWADPFAGSGPKIQTQYVAGIPPDTLCLVLNSPFLTHCHEFRPSCPQLQGSAELGLGLALGSGLPPCSPTDPFALRALPAMAPLPPFLPTAPSLRPSMHKMPPQSQCVRPHLLLVPIPSTEPLLPRGTHMENERVTQCKIMKEKPDQLAWLLPLGTLIMPAFDTTTPPGWGLSCHPCIVQSRAHCWCTPG